MTHGNEKHGLQDTPEYIAWKAMKQRCRDKAQKNYALYGGRGICVSPMWADNFLMFLADMGPRPSPKHSLDRTDNAGNYELGNCRWATYKEQNNNRRPRRLAGRQPPTDSTVYGVTYNKPAQTWSAMISIGSKAIRLGTHSTLLDAACARKSAELHFDKLRGRLD